MHCSKNQFSMRNANGNTITMPNIVIANSQAGKRYWTNQRLHENVVFIPNLIVKNSSGCQLTVSSDDTIRVDEVVVDAGLNLAICEGETIELNAVGSGSIVHWSPSVTLSSFSVNNPLANPIVSELYYVNQTNGICNAIDSVYVTVHNDVPNANFIANNLSPRLTQYYQLKI